LRLNGSIYIVRIGSASNLLFSHWVEFGRHIMTSGCLDERVDGRSDWSVTRCNESMIWVGCSLYSVCLDCIQVDGQLESEIVRAGALSFIPCGLEATYDKHTRYGIRIFTCVLLGFALDLLAFHAAISTIWLSAVISSSAFSALVRTLSLMSSFNRRQRAQNAAFYFSCVAF